MKKGHVFILVFLAIVFAASAAFGAPITLRYSHLAPAFNNQGQAVQMVADLVNKRTNGEVKIDVFPANQLGSLPEQFEGVRLGTIDFCMESMDSIYANMENTWKMCGWAFAFKNIDHLVNYTKSPAYKEAIDRLDKNFNLKVVAINWIRAPFKVLLFRKQVKSLEDFKGAKIRMPEVASQLKNWAALGANPTPMAFSEVFLALKQGIIDAMDCPFDLVYDMKFHTVAPYIMLSKHMYQPMAISASSKKFASLDKKYQDIIIQALNEAGEWYSQRGYADYEKNTKRLKDEGATIYEIDMTEWRKKSLEAAWDMEKKGEWPAGMIKRMLLDTEPK